MRVGGGSFKAKSLVEARSVLGYRVDDHTPRANALRGGGAPQQSVLQERAPHLMALVP